MMLHYTHLKDLTIKSSALHCYVMQQEGLQLKLFTTLEA